MLFLFCDFRYYNCTYISTIFLFYRSINPTENIHVAYLAFGEGWHNYHHVFPWDYKAAELGNYKLNFTTAFIDFMAYIGWAYELKTASPEMVNKRAIRTGDGTREKETVSVETDEHVTHGGDIWGWGDKSMKAEDIRDVRIYNKLE